MGLRHLLDLQSRTESEIDLILTRAAQMKARLTGGEKKGSSLKGRSLVTLFYEASTRTRTSFELAGKYLGADVVNITVAASSVQKGETLKDTARTIDAMGVDALVVRHSVSGVPGYLTGLVGCTVINAGDGMHEHPTQGLLDLFTIREKKGRLEGLKVAIVGDIAHSRVARSDIWGLTKMGAEVRLAGPATLLPAAAEALPVRVCPTLKEAVEGADVVNVLRLQLERQQKGLFPSVREYTALYGVSEAVLGGAAPDVIVMHPGPMNRGIEISAAVADSPRSVINEQVTNGVAVRMAILEMLMGGGR